VRQRRDSSISDSEDRFTTGSGLVIGFVSGSTIIQGPFGTERVWL